MVFFVSAFIVAWRVHLVIKVIDFLTRGTCSVGSGKSRTSGSIVVCIALYAIIRVWSNSKIE